MSEILLCLASQLPIHTQCAIVENAERHFGVVCRHTQDSVDIGFNTPAGFAYVTVPGSTVVEVYKHHIEDRIKKLKEDIDRLTAERDAIKARIKEIEEEVAHEN